MLRKHGFLVLFIASLVGVAGCTQEEADRFFLTMVVWTFGVIASAGSVTGVAFALIAAFQKKPRGFINLGVAIPCAVAAIALDAAAILYSQGTPGVDREDYFAMMMTATPVWWLMTAIAGVMVRPPVIEMPAPMMPMQTLYDAYGNPVNVPWPGARPMQPLQVTDPAYRTPPAVLVVAIMLPVVVSVAYYVGLYLVLPVHVAAHV